MTRKQPPNESGVFNPRLAAAFVLVSIGLSLGMFSVGAPIPGRTSRQSIGGSNVTGAKALGMPQLPASGNWSIVASPNINNDPRYNQFNSVTCTSVSNCWGVGSRNTPANPANLQTLIEHWDGTSWSIVSSPNVSSTDNEVLNSVACSAASDCWAVGFDESAGVQQTLIEHWDGTSWAIVSSPNQNAAPRNFLLAVTCTSTSQCWAVGGYSNGINQTLIEKWDGNSWTIVSSPNTSTTQYQLLSGVTCASSSQCWAIGSYYDGNIDRTLIENWDGNSWTIVTSPNATATGDNELQSVTCAAVSDCWAVGYYVNGSYYQTLVEHWNGVTWLITTSPNSNPTDHNYLYGVTCASASDCWAVGSIDHFRELIEHWNGIAWSVVTSPNVAGAFDNTLYGVSCTSTSDCWAVGYYNNNSAQTLAEHWDGSSWTIVTSPDVNNGFRPNILSGVTCTLAANCWAVGHYNDHGSNNLSVNQTLIEQWNGASWETVNSPNTSATDNDVLNSVACSSASDCWAVGERDSHSLIERWNGNAWSIVSSPSSGGVLTGVACVSASDCWAAGYYFPGGVAQTLVEHWNGAAWTIIPSPNISTSQWNELHAITCVSGSDCWAVGYTELGPTPSQTIIEHWDGNSWTLVTSPNTSPTQANFLHSVTCTSTLDCWAVGDYFIANGATQTLIEHWNGVSWLLHPSPNTSVTQSNALNGVTCASGTNCWAVGNYYTGPGLTQTLIQQWNGIAWTIVASPNTTSTESNVLNGVACASPSECFAVGDYSPAENFVAQTLIEAFTIPPPLNTVVSRQIHGSTPFDVDLPLTGNPGIECRRGVDSNYQMIFTFANDVTSVSKASTNRGAVSSTSAGPDSNQYTVNLSGVPNAQYITVSLNTVQDSAGNTGTVSGTVGVLLGDVDASRRVDSGDVFLARQQTLQPLPPAGNGDFRRDIDVSGRIDSGDVFIARQQTTTTLP
jgi:hypothetical protein